MTVDPLRFATWWAFGAMVTAHLVGAYVQAVAWSIMWVMMVAHRRYETRQR